MHPYPLCWQGPRTFPPPPRRPAAVTLVLPPDPAGAGTDDHWTAPLSQAMPGAAAELARVSDLLDHLRPLPDPCAMDAPPVPHPLWGATQVGFADGTVRTVVPGPYTCVRTDSGGTECGAPPDDLWVDTAPVEAPGWAAEMARIGPLPVVVALHVAPASVPAGGAVTITGEGWVGPVARIYLEGRLLGTANVHDTHLRWAGRIPADLTPGLYHLSADDSLREAGDVRMEVTASP